jgi:hypothetical protein
MAKGGGTHPEAICIRQDAPQQSGLPRPQKAGQHSDRELLRKPCGANPMQLAAREAFWETQRLLRGGYQSG